MRTSIDRSVKLMVHIMLVFWICVLACISSGQCQAQEKTENEKNALLLETAKSLYDTDTKTAVSLARMALKNSEVLSAEERFQALLTLGSALIKFDDYPEAETHLKTALEVAKELEDKKGVALVSRQLGVLEQHRGSFALSLAYLDSAKLVFDSIKDQAELAKTLVSIGNTYHFQGKNHEALKNVSEAYDIRQEYKLADTIACLVNEGIFRSEMGQYPEALKLYLDALSVYEARGDEYNISQVHSNLGILYKMTNEPDKSEKCYLKALTIQEKLGHRRKAHLSHNNLGVLYFEQGRKALGLQHLQKSLDEVMKIGSYASLWTPLLNLGYYHNEAGNHEKAIEFLLQAYTLSDTSDNMKGKALCGVHLASAYDALGRFDLTKKYGTESIKISGEFGNLPILEYALYTLQTIYKSHGEYEEALSVYEQFMSVRDSLRNAEKMEQIAKLEARYQLSEKELEIQRLDREKRELELNEEVSNLKMLGLIGILFVLSLGGLGYFRIQRIQIRQQQVNNSMLRNEVASVARQMAAKNRAMENLKEELTKVEKQTIEESNTQFLSLFKLIETNSKGDEDWNEFVSRFTTLHPTFFARLEKEHPELSNTELRLAALIKLRLTAKEIADVINITHQSVKQARYRLKKKLGLSQEQNLDKFFSEF